eukprot:TRINITY_DN26531_c0_g1_i1.p1 TRINITY_DN26531_c0_g1~~TRINITY_DN26531_c0_g1_i1.p1  ORF type:complete len:517 (-),score=106.13 TRINITY_DN26531_c0_g1_i1:168-1673(-)
MAEAARSPAESALPTKHEGEDLQIQRATQGSQQPEDELRDATAEEALIAGGPPLPPQIGVAYEDDMLANEVVFRPRSLRSSSPAVQASPDSPSPSETDATQRRCWVLPPAERSSSAAEEQQQPQPVASSDEPPGRQPLENEQEQAGLSNGNNSRSSELAVRGSGAEAAASTPTTTAATPSRLGRREQRPGGPGAEKAVRRTPSNSDRSRRAGLSATTSSLPNSRQPAEAADGPPLTARGRRQQQQQPASAAGATGTGSSVNTKAGPGTSRAGPGSAPTRRGRARSEDPPPETPNGSAEHMVPIDQLRRLEAQLATFRTRNAALEGEVAGLRSETEAVNQRYESELDRLRQELQSKSKQLQLREAELLAVQKETQEQARALQDFMASMTDQQQQQVQGTPAKAAAAAACSTPGSSLTTTQPTQAAPRVAAAPHPASAAPAAGQAATSPAGQVRQLRGGAMVDPGATWSYNSAVTTKMPPPATPPRAVQRLLMQTQSRVVPHA